jgi:predicted ester cyclase
MDAYGASSLPEDARAFFAAWIGHGNAGEWGRFATMMHPDIVLADPMMAEPARGREQAFDRARAQYAPFPDGRLEMIGDPFVSLEEPEFAYRWRFLGTHLHAIDPPGFAPTGRRVEIEGTSVLRFRDQQVVDVRLFFDATDAARQLLAAPSAGSPLEQLAVLVQRLRAWWSRRSHRE